MNDTELKSLLTTADASAPPPPGGTAVALSARVIHRAARRALYQRVAGMTSVGVACLTLLLSVIRFHQDERTVAMKESQRVVAIRAELAALDREAAFHLKVARAVAKGEASARREIAASRAMADDPVARIESERELAAAILMRDADREVTRPGQAEQAKARYERIVSMFPDTHAASEARRRLGAGG